MLRAAIGIAEVVLRTTEIADDAPGMTITTVDILVILGIGATTATVAGHAATVRTVTEENGEEIENP
jgi:hypothetical protein